MMKASTYERWAGKRVRRAVGVPKVKVGTVVDSVPVGGAPMWLVHWHGEREPRRALQVTLRIITEDEFIEATESP